MIRLITEDRERSGVSDNGSADDRIRILESHDRRVIARSDVDKRITQAKAVSELADNGRCERSGPRPSVILLFIVLGRLFTEDNVIV